MIRRHTTLNVAASDALAGLAPAVRASAVGAPAVRARGRKDSLVLAMTLEPPGLDPTAGTASAIAEVVRYHLLETLTKIRPDATAAPLLGTSWTVKPDNKTWAFQLRPRREVPQRRAVQRRHGEVRLRARRRRRQPEQGQGRLTICRVTIHFISDAAAQVAALLAGDVDLFPRVSAARNLAQFRADKRFQVLVGGRHAKTVLAMNDRKKPLDGVRVRRAIAMAIDRKQVIDGVANGFGTPHGSFYMPDAPDAPGHVDLTAVNAFNPDRARALLKEAGISTPLELSLQLPPAACARHGGEVTTAAVLAYLYQPTAITVAAARLQGVWKNMPIAANDPSALRWG